LFGANRWLSGRISAATKLQYVPHYMFIPDINENALIIREAVKRNIALIAIVSTDSPHNVDIPVFGNNKDFKGIVQIMRCLIYFSKQRQNSRKARHVYKRKTKSKWFLLYTKKKC